MRRIVTALLSTITVLVLLFSYRTSTNSTGALSAAAAAPAAVPAPATSGTPTPSPTTTSAPPAGSGGDDGAGSDDGGTLGATPSVPKATTPTKAPTGSRATVSGTFTGDAVMTQWGVVQVQISVSRGTITAATPVQYPNGNGRDLEINSYALPVLNQEVISAQSANIDMVSGATVTSGGYLQSLQSAIDQAHL